jgi:transcriptional regulator with XRE-family HTH domain
MLCGMTDHKVTAKSRTLGGALRVAREERGLKLRELAGQLSLDPSRLSKWELGKQIPKDTVVAQILTHLGVTGERYDEIVGLTSGASAGQWLAVSLPEQRQHLAALLDLEQHADTIVTVSPLLIPGLLQDGGYVRAIMSAGELPAEEISTRVAVRLGRRDAITRRENPARLRAFVGEAALRQIIGSRQVMVQQLQHLTQEAERENVELRVVPFDTGHHPGLEGPFTLIDPREDQGISAVVHIENRRSGLFLQEDEDVATYRHAVDTVAQVAMSLTDSIRLIATITDEMRSG